MSIRRAQDERIEGTPDGLNAVTEIVDVPDAPTIGTATAGTGSATVTYTAAATGGAVTTFTATSTPGSITGTGASPITVSGLTGGTSYTFTVSGANTTGTSPASAASNSVTPSSPTAGYIAGGDPNQSGFNNVIRKMPGSTEVFSALGATLSFNVSDSIPLINGSSTGYWAGGYRGGSPAGGKTIDKFVLATETRSTLAAELSFKKYNCGGVSNAGVAGYVSGGLKDDESGYANLTQIDKLNFSTEAKTTLAATVSDGAGYQSCYNVQNPGVAGYILRRDNTTVEKLNFSTEATSLLGNTRTNNTYNAFGFSNGSTSGFIVGGFSTAGQGYPRGGDKLNFSNETWSYISNILTSVSGGGYGMGGRYNGGSFGFAGVAGYMAGGYAEGYYGQVDKLAFSTDTPSLLGTGASVLGSGINTLVAAKGFSNG